MNENNPTVQPQVQSQVQSQLVTEPIQPVVQPQPVEPQVQATVQPQGQAPVQPQPVGTEPLQKASPTDQGTNNPTVYPQVNQNNGFNVGQGEIPQQNQHTEGRVVLIDPEKNKRSFILSLINRFVLFNYILSFGLATSESSSSEASALIIMLLTLAYFLGSNIWILVSGWKVLKYRTITKILYFIGAAYIILVVGEALYDAFF